MNQLERALKEAKLQTSITISDIHALMVSKRQAIFDSTKVKQAIVECLKQGLCSPNCEPIKLSLVIYRIYRKEMRNDAVDKAILQCIAEIVADRTK